MLARRMSRRYLMRSRFRMALTLAVCVLVSWTVVVVSSTPFFWQKLQDFVTPYDHGDWPQGSELVARGLAGRSVENQRGLACRLDTKLVSPFGRFPTEEWEQRYEIRQGNPCLRQSVDDMQAVEEAVVLSASAVDGTATLSIDTGVISDALDSCRIVFGQARYQHRPCEDAKLKRVAYTAPGVVVPAGVDVVRACCRDNSLVVYRQRRIAAEDKVLARTASPVVPTTHNLFLVMLDALSRAQFHRQLTDTSALLDQWMQQPELSSFRVFQFFRYGIVGVNSKPNQSAFSAISPELYSSDFSSAGFIWDLMQRRAGFATAMFQGECRHPNPPPREWADDARTDVHRFNIYCPGVPGSPANFKKPREFQCLGQRTVAEVMLQDAVTFFEQYSSMPRFVQVNVQDAHERTMRKGKVLDRPLHQLLLQLNRHPEFISNTPIFLFADHGMHYARYTRQTRVGAVEHKLPVLFVLAPKPFLQAYPEVETALQSNEQRLISQWDLYRTFLHAAAYPSDLASNVPSHHPGRSILREIPADRTCKQAGIPPEYCPCV